jgi:hypothetical protein
MNKIEKMVLFTIISMSLVFSSCSKNEPDGPANSVSEGVIKAKVDGAWVTTESMTGAANLVERVGTLTLLGSTAGTSSKSFMFVVNGFEGAGEYAIGGSNNIAVSGSYTEIAVNLSNPSNSQSNSWQAPYTGGNEVGKITIKEVTDTHVIGTFQFKAKNTKDNTFKEITEGSFNLKLRKS